MFAMLLVAVVSVQPVAAPEIQYRSHDVAGALKRGCKVQRVHVAGGKAELRPIVRCPASQTDPAVAAARARG